MILSAWAARHNVPSAALDELRAMFLADAAPDLPSDAKSEAAVQNAIRLDASKRGDVLWRNNVGAGHVAESGSFLRWGLCNDSKELNKRVKSGDCIGIRRVLITPQHVGSVIGQFWSIECKHQGWRYTGTDRERAQLRWIEMITALGGRAQFSTGEI